MLFYASLRTLDSIIVSSEMAINTLTLIQEAYKTYLAEKPKPLSLYASMNHPIQVISTNSDDPINDNCGLMNGKDDPVEPDVDSIKPKGYNGVFVTFLEKKRSKSKKKSQVSRVFNSDSLLKKIKAKYLKYLFNCLRNELFDYPQVSLTKFSQGEEVRNIDIHHNQEILNMTVMEYTILSGILQKDKLNEEMKNLPVKAVKFLKQKVKNHYQFDFLRSAYLQKWLEDPLSFNDIIKGKKNFKPLDFNKNCLKFENYSKNVFKNQKKYDEYKKVLFTTCYNYIFYFENNSFV